MAAKLRFYSQKYTEAYHSASNTSVMTLCSLANIKITGSQNQQLLDPVHIINQTSSITFSGSHDNRTSVSRHPIILCWLATAQRKIDQLTNHTKLYLLPSFSFLFSITQTTPLYSILPDLSLFEFLSSFFLDPPPSLLAFSHMLQTAIFHNLSIDHSHNSEPPFNLHTHSVQSSCKSLSPTPHSLTSKASHAEVK